MNLLYYLPRFPKLSESFILNEIRELEMRGHNVAVFAMNDHRDELTHEEYDAIDAQVRYAEHPSYTDALRLISTKVINPTVLKHSTFVAPLRKHLLALYRGRQCIDFVEELDMEIDLVHAHFATIGTFAGRYAASCYDVPFTVTAHAYDLYKRPNEVQLKHFLAESDHVLTISEYNRTHIRRELESETPISVVHMGIRPEKFKPTRSAATTRLLTVCRFVEKKGLLYAINAVSKLTEQFPDLEYYIVGSGPMEEAIRAQIEEHDLGGTVELLENVSDERLIAEFDDAACFVLPCIVADSGDRDGIPVALMEAMAMETPPVSTDVSGIPELIDHQQNGLIVEPKDADELADAIASVLADSDERRRFGRAGRRKVKREFNVEREVGKLESVFRQATTRQ